MNKNVDLIFDILDQAAMIYYENLRIDYLDALSEIDKNLNMDLYHRNLSDEVIKKLEFCYKPILEGSFLNEEIRLALELYIVKGLKHANYAPNLMTPDFINYLFVLIIRFLFENKDISILDTSLGSGNLLAAIKNNYEGKASLIGIENDQKLVSFTSSFMNIQHNEIKIYFQDALNKVLDGVNLVVGDLDGYYIDENPKIKDELYLKGVRYFPYLVICSRLDNILADGYFIYLVDNDFFSLDYREVFLDYLQKQASILGAIVLPDSLFQAGYTGKMILIGKKSLSKNKEINVVEIAGTSPGNLEAAINKIKTMIDRIKEE